MVDHPETPRVEPVDAAAQDRPGAVRNGWKSLVGNLAGLRGKLIIPYVLLSVSLALVGVYVVTRLVTSSLHERFVNQLYEASRVASDGIVRQERKNLDNLRLMVFTQGVPEALAARDAETLETLLSPLMVNNKIYFVAAVDASGIEIRTWDYESFSKVYLTTEGHDFSSYPLVSNILQGAVDAIGDKYIGFLRPSTGLLLVTSAPVYDDHGVLTGVLLAGTPVIDMLAEIKGQALADLILLDNDDQLISTTLTADNLELSAQLTQARIQSEQDMASQSQELKLESQVYQIIFTHLWLREQSMGSLVVALPSSYVVSAEATSRNTFSLVFTLGTAGTILIGYLLAQNISRPILHLRSLSQSVASGDLNQASGLDRTDEIGDLADAFDQMTENLRQRTAEAERLYSESVQRNEELAAINTRLQETQLQLVQSEKLAAVGLLTAGIVHDVKNPLTVIRGTAELLQEDEELTPELTKALSLIREGAIKANKIISDLLTFARQAPPELKPQDLRETVQAALRLTTYMVRQAQVRTTSELPDEPVMTIYDATQIEQVFINLINNAVQAMPDRGALHIRLTQVDGYAVTSFADTGTGIAPEHLHRIFDPFFTTKPEGQGTGLGLSVGYGIVASHGGRIEVSSAVGQGSTFTIYLPLDQR
jgi:two-component system NtrC family sensor kinase